MPKVTGIDVSMTDFAKMEQRIAADIVEERRRYWDPRYATKNARPWGRTLLRRKRERIAIAVRDTAEILYQTEGCEPLLVIYDLLHSAVLSGFIPNDLADPDVCLALATMSPPQVGTLPYTARVLARAARFARSPSLPCPWGIFSRRYTSRSTPVEIGADRITPLCGGRVSSGMREEMLAARLKK